MGRGHDVCCSLKAMSRISPPHAGQTTGNLSAIRVSSFAHAMREASWECYCASMFAPSAASAVAALLCDSHVASLVWRGRLLAAPSPDPLAALLPRLRVADALGVVVATADYAEPIEGRRGIGTIPHQMFDILAIDTHVEAQEPPSPRVSSNLLELRPSCLTPQT